MEPVSKNYANTGMMPQADFIAGMFEEGGIPAMLTTCDYAEEASDVQEGGASMGNKDANY